MRKIMAAVASAAILLSVSACSSVSSPEDMFNQLKSACGDPLNTQESTASVDAITVSTEAGLPTYDFASPLTGDSLQTKVISEGKGPKITGNQLVQFEFQLVNAANGEDVQHSSFDGSDSSDWYLSPDMQIPLCKAMAGVREGSRAVVFFPAKVAHENQGVPEFGIGKDDSLIFILDVVKVFLPRAVGNEKPAQSGFPSVVRAVDGTPGVNINSDANPPTAENGGSAAVATEVLIEGAGEPLKAGDSAVLHYSGYLWADGTKFDSSWDSKQPATFTLTEGGLIQGFIDGLVGQKIGSQVVIVIPPVLGYGNQAQGTIPANSTLVFVVDILGVKN